jgi:hypothetical protein
MDAFNPTPPEWTNKAIHALKFCCPNCRGTPGQAIKVWINRHAPVTGENYRRKWQEFYQCQCLTVWWAWNSDRPPSDLTNTDRSPLF